MFKTLKAPCAQGSALHRWLGRYCIVLTTLALTVALFTILRIVLLAVYVDRSTLAFWDYVRIFSVGFRFDLLVGLVLLIPQTLHMTLHTNQAAKGFFSRLGIQIGLLITIAFLLFIMCAEFLFFAEFDSRFNYIAFEYLVYPTEVLTNIWETYPLVAVLGGIAAVTVVMFLFLRPRILAALGPPLPLRRRVSIQTASFGLIAVLALTTGPASLALTRNRVANECAANGLYSFCYYAWTNRFDYEPYYRTLDEPEAFAQVQALVMGSESTPIAGSAHPLDRTVVAPGPQRDWNVVLILIESLGSDFVGVLGDDRGLTPQLDQLAERGILFDHFYATGNRTARALEAAMTSIPPIPTESILKRDHSGHVYTLAHVLGDRGYETVFVYGGRGLFDGMRSFMLNNGFERFIEQSDYESPTMTTAWGVCDEDIYDRALSEFDALEARHQPFFGTVLTVSNHTPFTYPDGRIDLPSDEQRRENAVKYSDYALGRFLDEAREHAFYDHTIFVALGDHGARVYGAEMFPVRSYRVPVLMILPGGVGAGTRCSTVASTLDLAPMILGKLGGSYRSTFFGRDALAIDPASAYALMQHNHNLAMLDADGLLTMLGMQKAASAYRLDPDTLHLLAAGEPDPARLKAIIALFQTANRLYYDDRLYPEEKRVQ